MPRTMYIERVYHAATDAELQAGANWYKDAQSQCRVISLRYGTPLHLVAAVVAALSPNNRWNRNLLDAAALISAFNRGKTLDAVSTSTYPAMKEKAWHLLMVGGQHSTCIDILRGPKIQAFYRNIMGDDCVTVDGHAKNIYYGKRETLKGNSVGVKEFRKIAVAYQAAGIKHGIPASEMQAITWLAWRRLQGIT